MDLTIRTARRYGRPKMGPKSAHEKLKLGTLKITRKRTEIADLDALIAEHSNL